MNPTIDVNAALVEVDGERQALAELKALFPPTAGNEPSTALAVKSEAKVKPVYFDRFRGKIRFFVN